MYLDIFTSIEKSTTILGIAQMVGRRTAFRLPSPAARLAPSLHGGQTSRPDMQTGGMAQNGIKETGLKSIKNGMLMIMVSGFTDNTLHSV